jgi:hypothetical protein
MKKTFSNSSYYAIIGAFLTFGSLILTSCRKENFSTTTPKETAPVFPKSPQEKEIASLTNEIGQVLDEVYLNHDAFNEVNAAIYSGFEKDECITVNSLLQPNSSALYKSENFKKMYIKPGSFYRSFKEALSKGDYPLIKKYYGKNFQSTTMANRNPSPLTTMVAVDSGLLKQEIWVVNSVKIYFPYSENFSTMYRPDNPGINQPDGRYFVTKVTADRDADSGPGREPYLYYGTSRTSPPTVKYNAVTVDDNYAEVTPTHIVNVMDVKLDPTPPVTPPPASGPIYKVYVGWVRDNKHQYDVLISLSGNGGGSELQFGRGYAYQDANGQVQSDFPFAPVFLSRKAIRKANWVHVLMLWDTNWRTDQLDHKLGIYEDDTRGSVTFTGSVSGNFRINGVNQTVSTGISITKPSQDAIIRNLNLDRDFFFHNGTTNQGWGFQDLWPIYDGGSIISYTLPYEIVY